MQTQFVFRQMESSDAMRHYAEERLGKIRRYFSDPLKVSATFAVDKIQHVAHFEVTLRNGLRLQSSESTENMYSSIDMALAKMERQVRRYKDRITNHQAHEGRATKVRQAVLAAEAIDSGEAAAPRSTPRSPSDGLPAVVREKEFRAERLDVYEAIMQMNLLHKDFLVFTNHRTGDINVVYRHADGNYGLIETRGHVDPNDG